jgi:hypothetical protein
MKRTLKTAMKVALAVAVVAGVLFYGLAFGPLFAFSPVKFGFDELRLARCSIFYPRGTTPDRAYSKLDDLMAEAERFHGLSFKKRVRVIVCATNPQYRRFSLASGNACTSPTGAVIYVRPSIADATYPPRVGHENGKLILLPPANTAKRDLASFLKHELSHAILYQNTTLWKAMKINRWLEEGLAIYFGNAHHYYARQELRSLAIDDAFWFNLVDEEAEPTGIPDTIRHFFSYGVYGDFARFLIETYGRDAFLGYVREYIQGPGNEEALFLTRFGISLNDAVARFREHLAASSGV